MRQIVYSLHFRGTARPADNTGKAFRVTGAAVSASFTTLVTASGLQTSFAAQASDDDAILDSELTFVGQSSFTESGSISFGEGHSVRFTTIGQGYLRPGPESNLMCGAVSRRIDSGEGQFAGAHGIITSNFTLDQNGELNDYQTGVLFVQSA